MKVKSRIGWQGKIKVIVYGQGFIKEVIELQNTLPNISLNMVRNALKGTVSDLKIKYLAWGSDDTAPTENDTQLGAEFGRKQVTQQVDGGDGELITTTYISPFEGNEEIIEELGWFGGASANGDPNTGILIARVLYSRAKTTAESLQVERTDLISEVV